jgi:hypothetical protein
VRGYNAGVIRVAIAAALGTGCTPGPRPLFDGKTLDGWRVYLAGFDGDPYGAFAVEDGMIHLNGPDFALGQFSFGYLITTDEYENYRVRFEYKWGTKSYVPWGFDSGFFVSTIGDDQVWPRGIECQVAGHDTGSMYMFDRVASRTSIDPAIAAATYMDGGTPVLTARDPVMTRVTHAATVDSLDDWNTVELVVSGASLEFVVNGATTFRADNVTQPDPDDPDDPSLDTPLTRGRIAIQNEGGEAYYRNIMLEPL